MNLQELNAFAVAKKVDELNLISMEGGIYLLEARMHGTAYPLSDLKGNMLTLRSVEHARDLLHAFHTSVHDEMCGLVADLDESLKVPLAWRSAL
ncbi:DUF6482 family protein [Pseudomonas sp. RG1]|uniref:DUF6482 family protein n=1 Tax=Pseudomonas sp. RG1 TaxID=2981602 RepID=UPI00221E9D15|nr:DUF6482 family protein [Pseudomonas sp. RG1]MCW0923474.1 DUF6482 family protein [Pseudomonas sp. RG1]